MLQLISLIMLMYSYFLIRSSIPTLPRVIPTHFNAAGVADGWGSPDVLWMMLGAQALTCVIFFLAPLLGQRAPGMVHFGSRRLSDFPPEQRGRAVSLFGDMAGYMSALMNFFFVFLLRDIIQAVSQPNPRIQVFWPLGLLMVGTGVIMLYYLRLFRRLAKGEDDSETSSSAIS